MPENENKENVPVVNVAAEEILGQKKEKQPPSALFIMLSNILFVVLLVLLGLTVTVGVFTLDFLDIYTFRYNIPEGYRKSWPLSSYYDFVQRHQLPEEQKYHEMMLDMRSELNELLTKSDKDLQTRAKQLEDSYRALIKTQNEIHSKAMKDINQRELELKSEKTRLEKEKSEFEIKRSKNEELAHKLASETANVESSLIKFMENQNRLDQICSIAAQMNPKSVAKIFDELPDDKLIYDIMGGLQPSHSAKVLSEMDAEKASKVMRIGNQPITLPEPNQRPSYVPAGLQSLLNETATNAAN
jgi:flagellar motility protein MotE (MotC chaperone)